MPVSTDCKAPGGDGEALLYVGVGSISAGVMALAVGLVLNSGGTSSPTGEPAAQPQSSAFATRFSGAPPASVGEPVASVFETRFPSEFATSSNAQTANPQTPDRPGMRLASLDPGISASAAEEPAPELSVSAPPRASFADRFAIDPRLMISFDERFSTNGSANTAYQAPAEEPQQRMMLASLPPVDVVGPTQSVRAAAPAALTRSLGAPDKRTRTADLPKDPSADVPKGAASPADAAKDPAAPSDDNSRTAIYDIAARVVYLPNGERLEAHSGLGEHMDDIRYVDLKGRGPTPPNVYKLTLRERLFHGVRAIRLVPVDETKMYGRDGMLAHTYMLGPNGQSNGCVSFNNYEAFLNAYLRGEVDRLVVVERLDTPPPGSKTASGWLTDKIKSIFGRS